MKTLKDLFRIVDNKTYGQMSGEDLDAFIKALGTDETINSLIRKGYMLGYKQCQGDLLKVIEVEVKNA